MGDSGLFDEPGGGQLTTSGGTPIEPRLDSLADAAKQATQLAGKIRLGLTKVAEGAQTGDVANVQGQLGRLAESVNELSALINGISQYSSGFQFGAVQMKEYFEEVQSELSKRGVTVTKGAEPYWLVYPAWFKIESGSKGSLEVVLNGERIDSIRPTVVASTIADAVNGKFNAKQFKDLLFSVRDVIRRAGAPANSLALDDVYEVLNMGSGRRSARTAGFSKAAFYYAVHRLAESADSTPGPPLSFPSADYDAPIFFSRDGEGRKYMTVQFVSAR